MPDLGATHPFFCGLIPRAGGAPQLVPTKQLLIWAINPVNEVSVTTPLRAATIAIETTAMSKAYSTTWAPLSFRMKPANPRQKGVKSDLMGSSLNST